MKKIMFFLLLLCGCVQNRFLYTDENGNDVYQVKCGDLGLDYGDCFIEANKMCIAGFKVIMSSENQTGAFMNTNTSGTLNSFNNINTFNMHTYGNSWNAYNRYLIYSCNK